MACFKMVIIIATPSSCKTDRSLVGGGRGRQLLSGEVLKDKFKIQQLTDNTLCTSYSVVIVFLMIVAFKDILYRNSNNNQLLSDCLYLTCKSLYSPSPHRRSAPRLAASGWTDLSSSDHLSSFVSGRESCLVMSWKSGRTEVVGCL